MFYNLSSEIQLDFNSVTKNASLVVIAKTDKPTFIYCIDSIMFDDMISAIQKLQTEGKGSVTITSPYLNNRDTITVNRNEDYIKVNVTGNYQVSGKSALLDKSFYLKTSHVEKFVASITGKPPVIPTKAPA